MHWTVHQVKHRVTASSLNHSKKSWLVSTWPVYTRNPSAGSSQDNSPFPTRMEMSSSETRIPRVAQRLSTVPTDFPSLSLPALPSLAHQVTSYHRAFAHAVPPSRAVTQSDHLQTYQSITSKIFPATGLCSNIQLHGQGMRLIKERVQTLSDTQAT